MSDGMTASKSCGVWYRGGVCRRPPGHDGLHLNRMQVDLAAAEQRAQAAETERDALRAGMSDLLAFLEANERRPEKNMRGTMTNFCVACGGAPTIHALNPTTSTPDGHWTDGARLPAGGCILWQLGVRLRNLLRAAEGGEQR